MLMLPTGQILLTYGSNDIEIYTPTITERDKEHEREIAPVVFGAPREIHRGSSYQVFGRPPPTSRSCASPA
jgi:hypothetical protein